MVLLNRSATLINGWGCGDGGDGASASEAVTVVRDDPSDHTLLGHHRGAVVVPVRVLAGHRSVVLDQFLDRCVVRARPPPATAPPSMTTHGYREAVVTCNAAHG